MTDALIVRGDALHLPLADESVDLIVTSPPYFAQRSYRDSGEHYDGQIGSEPSPAEFLGALWSVLDDCWRVLKRSGSVFVNLGDKRAGVGAPGTTSGLTGRRTSGSPIPGQVQGERSGMTRFSHDRTTEFGRPKSRMGLPERFVIGCEDGMADPDGIGWIYRQRLTWEKPNGMPESVTDRTRDNFEDWYHLVRAEDYYSAADEIREPSSSDRAPSRKAKHVARDDSDHQQVRFDGETNPLGRLPGSVWRISTEGLATPDYMVLSRGDDMRPQWFSGDDQAWTWSDHVGVDRSPWPRPTVEVGPFLAVAPEHFAAFPTEWPRRLILGWSPPAICLDCGEGRFPVVARSTTGHDNNDSDLKAQGVNRMTVLRGDDYRDWIAENPRTIVGYACACTPRTDNTGQRGDWRDGRTENDELLNEFDAGSGNTVPRRPGGFGTRVPEPAVPRVEYHLDGWTPPPTRPAVVLDPFGGTGTTAMVARALGRIGVSLDLSSDYCRIAGWRIFESGHGRKAVGRTDAERQGSLL